MNQQDFNDDSNAAQEEMNRYIERLEKAARFFIIKFFSRRRFHCGGAIPKNKLLSQNSINIVLSTNFCDGIDECYKVMPNSIPEEQLSNLISLLSEVKMAGIPKKLQTGIMLLYYRFCKGFNVEDKALNIAHLLE